MGEQIVAPSWSALERGQSESRGKQSEYIPGVPGVQHRDRVCSKAVALCVVARGFPASHRKALPQPYRENA
ncbi:MAG: hypothetical protein N3A38_16630, partial [Planctomycetota bacterium]|nr:hypothetical protein [Planctomycetota bacterium]